MCHVRARSSIQCIIYIYIRAEGSKNVLSPTDPSNNAYVVLSDLTPNGLPTCIILVYYLIIYSIHPAKAGH